MRRESRIVACVLIATLSAAGLGAPLLVAKVLPEATILSSIDGKLLHADANDTWWFELTTEFKSDTFRVPSGRRFMLLPSRVLEQLIADVNDRVTPSYRLSAQVTRYQGANYLLATYFLPLSKFKDAKPQATGRKREVAAGDLPTDPELAIPREIAEKLKDSRPVRGPLRKPSDGLTNAQPQAYLGRMLVNRVGLIETGNAEASLDSRIYASTPSSFYFTPYALGWNVSSERYELLPCGALEQAQQLQRGSIEPIRFNVAGLVTQFGGRQYLLLQRAAPVYNYGNFGR